MPRKSAGKNTAPVLMTPLASRLWRIIKTMNGDYTGPQILPIASHSGDPLGNSDKAEVLARSFALASSNANLSPRFARIRNNHHINIDSFQPQGDDSPLSDPISLSEVHNALKKCENSSPGCSAVHAQERIIDLIRVSGEFKII